MRRNKWINEKVYNHLGEEVKLVDDYIKISEAYKSSVSCEDYLNLDKYTYRNYTLSERLVMCKVSMMYRGKIYPDDKGLDFLTGHEDKLSISEIWNCKSWKSLCNKVQYIILGYTEPIDEMSVLINLITRLLESEYNDHKGDQCNRTDIILALRLYYISGYDRSILYKSIESLKFPYNSDNIKDSILCVLKLLRVWKTKDLYQMLYESARCLMVRGNELVMSRNLVKL